MTITVHIRTIEPNVIIVDLFDSLIASHKFLERSPDTLFQRFTASIRFYSKHRPSKPIIYFNISTRVNSEEAIERLRSYKESHSSLFIHYAIDALHSNGLY